METTTPFSEYALDPSLINRLDEMGFNKASPIQELTIAPILEGKDIFAQAETGSGKTGAFAIPLIQKIIELKKEDSEHTKGQSYYVVLSPTRELAQQTYAVTTKLGESLGISAACLIGGENIEKQKETLEDEIHFLIATPGRLRDLTEQKVIDLGTAKGIVFDEADRLFDMGFKKDIEYILGKFPKSRQLIMVSATSNLDVLNTAYKFHSTPIEIKLNEDNLLVDNIDHKLAMLTSNEKMPLLVNMLRKKDDLYSIIFCNTQIQTHCVAEWLTLMGFKAKPISGRLAQAKRTKLMEEFRNKQITILVCTDVAARGLDIQDVNFVVNYDMPTEAASYVHRIGRTGRAGKAGEAISFCAHEDCENLDAIYEYIDAKIPKLDLSNDDFATDICRKPYIDYKTLKVVEREQPRKRDEKPKRIKRENEKKMETKKDFKDTKQENKKPVDRAPRKDRRLFEITSSNQRDSDKLALEFFRLEDESLLGHKVLEQGKRKFFFFGARTTKYQYFIKPIYKKLLLPFLIDLVKHANLSLFVNLSYKEPHLTIQFSGKDEGLLFKNKKELLFSFEHLIKVYLSNKIPVPRGLRIHLKGKNSPNNSNKKEDSEKYLIGLADKMKAKIEDNSEPVLLKSLDPASRRIIHQYFSEDSRFKTESIGEGRFKKIEISFK